MKFVIKIICLIGFLVLVSCNKPGAPDCFKTTGKQTSKTISVTPFYAVDLETNLELTLKKGNEFLVEISGGENMVDKITASVTSGTLIIDNKNKCNFVRGYKKKISVTVTCPDYKYIVTNTIGNVFIGNDFVEDTLVLRSEAGDFFVGGTFNQLRTSSHGSGNMHLKCTTNDLQCYMNGTNYVYAYDANILGYIFIETYSLGNAYVTIPSGGLLEYNIQKSGNIYYKGNPAEIKGTNGGKGGFVLKE